MRFEKNETSEAGSVDSERKSQEAAGERELLLPKKEECCCERHSAKTFASAGERPLQRAEGQ